MKMKAKKMTPVLLAIVFGVVLTLVNVVLSIVWRFQAMGPFGFTDNLLTTLLVIFTNIALLGYGYVLLRKRVPNDKAQWYLVLTSTIALTLSTVVAELVSFFILDIGIGSDVEYRLNSIIILFSLITNFLLSLGVVYVIAQVYKRRSGFEVE